MDLLMSLAGVAASAAPLSMPLVPTEGVYLGMFAVVEPADHEFFYEISPDSVEFIESTGRHVWELRPGPKYYAKATPDCGQIVSIRPITVDMDSLVFLVGELEKESILYGDTEVDEINRNVLGFLRATNRRYAFGDNWMPEFTYVCGPLNGPYIESVKAASIGHGFKYIDFFGRLVAPNDYYHELLGDLTSGLPSSSACDIGDSLEPSFNTFLDISHLFASTQANYEGSNVTLRYPDIASWAGDLQSMANEVSSRPGLANVIDGCTFSVDFGNMSNIFQSMMQESGSCSRSDIISDIDAIANSWKNMNYLGKTVSESLASYYSPTSNVAMRRYDNFLRGSVEYQPYPNNPLLERFKNMVYYDLGITRDGNNLSNNTTVDPRLMKLNERGNDSFERRKKIAQGFIDFILTNSTLGVPSC